MASDLVSMMEREREKYREQRDRARTELEEAERWLEKIDAFLAAETPSEGGEAEGPRDAQAARRRPRRCDRTCSTPSVRTPPPARQPRISTACSSRLGYKRSAINAALFQLTKEGAIQQSGRRQPYKVVSGGAASAQEIDDALSTEDAPKRGRGSPDGSVTP